MPTIDQIEQAAERLTALLEQLPADSGDRHNALEHAKAVVIYARAALAVQDETPAPSGESGRTE